MATQETKAKRAARRTAAADQVAKFYQANPQYAAARILPRSAIPSMFRAGSGMTMQTFEEVARLSGLTITDAAPSAGAVVGSRASVVYGPGGTASGLTAGVAGKSSMLMLAAAGAAVLFLFKGRKGSKGKKRK